jgi:RNase H-fold protein (predicted Holliday junction resolvase)
MATDLLIFFFFVYLVNTNCLFLKGKSRLSIDYGPRVIGIARSTIMGKVEPYGTVRNNGDLMKISNQIVSLAKQWDVFEMVVGVPVDSDGRLHYNVHNLNGRLSLNFSQVLSTVAAYEVNRSITTLLFDERFTTKEAKLRLMHSKVKGIN